jgi:methylated-DNA-protein-cysteine methyltransferase-like protein
MGLSLSLQQQDAITDRRLNYRGIFKPPRRLFKMSVMPKEKPPNPLFAKIRATIMRVPRGKVSTYGAIAEAAGIPRGARLVVRVLGQSHGLPWQRIVASGGRIAIPGEGGLDQRFRLEMEGVKFSGRKVRMTEFEYKFPRKKTTKQKITRLKKSTGKRQKRAANQRETRES